MFVMPWMDVADPMKSFSSSGRADNIRLRARRRVRRDSTGDRMLEVIARRPFGHIESLKNKYGTRT